MFSKTTAFAAAIAISTTSAFAGGLSPEIIESPVTEDDMMVAGPSIEPGYIVLGVLAALLIAAAVSDNDDDNDPEEEPAEEEPEIIESIDGGDSAEE
jgi:hypothetical protein